MAMLVPGRRITSPCVLSFSQAVKGWKSEQKRKLNVREMCVFSAEKA